MAKPKNTCKKTSIGGQALIEGVMMRGPKKSAMAVRHIGTGDVVLKTWDTAGAPRPAVTKWPIIRGVFAFVDSLMSGYRSMMQSADLSGYTELEEAETAKKQQPEDAETAEETVEPAETAAPRAEKAPEKLGDKLMAVLMVVGSVLGVVLSVVLFIYLPSAIYNYLIKPLSPEMLDNRVIQSVFEGVLKLAIFVGYVAATSLMKDIRRVYMYHGAEHKTIFCYENGLPLSVENVRLQRRFHPRCGTSFMILMLIVGMIIGMFIPTAIPAIWRTLIKLLLLPLSVGIGYEAIKLCGRCDNWFTRVISAPGTWLQHITTREPDDGMIECAIQAFSAVIPEEEQEEGCSV